MEALLVIAQDLAADADLGADLDLPEVVCMYLQSEEGMARRLPLRRAEADMIHQPRRRIAEDDEVIAVRQMLVVVGVAGTDDFAMNDERRDGHGHSPQFGGAEHRS